MDAPSIIFFSVFVLPLVAFLIWIMRQDKRKGITGIIVVIALVVVAIVWTYLKRDADKKLPPQEKSGSMQPHVDK